MKNRPKFGIKSLMIAVAFVALGCMWWVDRQLLCERLLDEQKKVERVTHENVALRQSVRSGQADIDKLFAHTLVQTDAINKLKTVSDGLQKRLRSGQ